MSTRRKRWLYVIAATSAAVFVGLLIAASVLANRFEPFIRDQAILYMEQRFNCDVELASLRVKMPKLSPLNVLLRKGRGATARVEGEGISMRYKESPDLPPLFRIKSFHFDVDLGALFEEQKIVDRVDLEGMEIHIPPKGERRSLSSGGEEAQGSEEASKPPNVLIRHVRMRNAKLAILPKDASKKPLTFDLTDLRFESIGPNQPMKYDAQLTNPKPPGQVQAAGTFGPWVTAEPGDTQLSGDYTFHDADLSVFKSIAGKLQSKGSFKGRLSSIDARGEATVPDFRLAMAGNPVPLYTKFEVLVDGTNGNTILQPVEAKLGSTQFRTSGGVIKHEGDKRRSIELDVLMPNGYMRDVLRLAMKGAPFMEGRLYLKTKIAIPPLSGSVREKLRLNGNFRISDGKFLRSTIQDQIDGLSRRGQGAPKNDAIDEVVSGMHGSFRLENEKITFREIAFEVPGAAVDLAGTYDMDADSLDFLGSLKLQARVSQTMTGWKRWALKPVDPFFAKNGAGTFLRIAVDGSSSEPKFGLARGRTKEEQAK